MKLHLPKGLLVAVLAVIGTPSYAVNTGWAGNTLYLYGEADSGVNRDGFGEVSHTGNLTSITSINASSSEGGANKTGKITMWADETSSAVTIEQFLVNEGTTISAGINNWGADRHFSPLIINEYAVVNEGAASVEVVDTGHNVVINKISGSLSSVHNAGTLSLGSAGNTTTINGIINNTGTLTLVGTFVASGNFVSDVATANGYTSTATITGMTGNGTYSLTGASFQTAEGTAFTLQDGVYTAEKTGTQYHVVSGTVKANEVSKVNGHTGFTVYGGATLDVNGNQLNSQRIVLRADATLANNGSDVANETGYNKEQVKNLELEGNATVDTTGNLGVVASNWAQATVALNNYTLTKTGGDMLCIANAAISAGKIDIQEGTVKLVDKTHTSATGTLSMDSGLIINVEEGASLEWWSDKDAKEYGGKEDTSYTSFLRNVTGEGTINIDLAEGSAVVIHGSSNESAHKVNYSGTMVFSADTKLALGAAYKDNDGYTVQRWGLDMSETTISISGGGLRFLGCGTTIGTLDVNAADTLLIHDSVENAGVSLTINTLNLDANLTVNKKWKGSLAIGGLQGSGSLIIDAAGVPVSVSAASESFTGAISVAAGSTLTLGTADSVVYLSKTITNNGSLTLANVSFALDNMAYERVGDTSVTGVIEVGHKYTLVTGSGSMTVEKLAFTHDGEKNAGSLADDNKSVTYANTIYNIAAGGSASAATALQAKDANETSVSYVNVLGTMSGLSDSAWATETSTPILGSGTVQVTGLLENGAEHMADFTGTVLVDGTGENKGRIHLGNKTTRLSNAAAIELVGAPGLTVNGESNKGYVTGWGGTFSQQILLKGGAINADKNSKWQNITVENAVDATDTTSYYVIMSSGTGITGGTLKLNGGTLKILNNGSNSMQLGGNVRFDGGALDLNNQTVDSGTKLNNLQVVRDSTGHIKNGTVYISTFDMRGGNANPYGGTLELTNAHLQIDGAIWMHEENTQVLLHDDSSIKADYAVISHTGTDNDASVVSTGSGVANDNFVAVSDVVISNANVAVNHTDAKTVSAQLSNSSVENAGTGTLTATNAANNLSGINAAAGNINLQNVDLSVQQELLSLSIAEGMTVAAHVGTQELDSADGKVKLTVASTGTATFANNSTLNADLEIKSGAKVTANGALNLNGSALTLGSSIALTGEIADALSSGEQSVKLFTGITSLVLNGTTYDSTARVAYNPVDLEEVFTFDGLQEDKYQLHYSGGELFATCTVPEPATATLSLLALAGLCARRRRKS